MEAAEGSARGSAKGSAREAAKEAARCASTGVRPSARRRSKLISIMVVADFRFSPRAAHGRARVDLARHRAHAGRCGIRRSAARGARRAMRHARCATRDARLEAGAGSAVIRAGANAGQAAADTTTVATVARGFIMGHLLRIGWRVRRASRRLEVCTRAHRASIRHRPALPFDPTPANSTPWAGASAPRMITPVTSALPAPGLAPHLFKRNVR